jgi:NAD(P)-dependent dehydrogenase (short-subunit alcohol dehydrogenase family)
MEVNMNKKVFITGVSKGIGRAIAERFIKEGYTLYGTYFLDEKRAKELTKTFGADRVKLYGPYDFTKTENTEKLLRELKSEKFDAIVCSAGIFSENDDFGNFDLSKFNETMNCNFYAPLILTTGLKDNISDGGSIVIMSSNDAFPGAFSSMSYSISKSALLSLMKCLSVNFGAKKVRVNSVAPGAIDTDMNTPEQMNIAPYFTPIGCTGTPEDVAKVVYFLSSNEASFISGENITIDGGYNIMSVLLKSEADKTLSKNLQTFIKNKNGKA